jgi:hypothetical protein
VRAGDGDGVGSSSGGGTLWPVEVVDLEGLVQEVVVVLGPGLVLMLVGLEHLVVLLIVASEEGGG